jgi:adenylate cyclase
MFAKAAGLDPLYARAHASMVICDCYLREWHGHAVAAEATLPIAEKALDLDPSLPEAYIAYGFALFGHGRYDEAERSYRQALSLDPNSYEANFFFASTMMRFRRDRVGMVSLFTLAAQLRPDDYISPMMVAAFLPWSDPRRPDWARSCIERAERAAKLNPQDPSPLHRGAVAYAYLGDKESAHGWLTKALAIEPDDFVAHVNASSIHAQFGEANEALHHLEKAARQAPRKTIEMLLADIDYDPIREDPRFSQILPLQDG